jgi:flavin reductase (DIM6/NTAB) family NADH-FMN oxidoreductase RutF
MVKETDYCGIISGPKADKVATCKFTVFYGNLENSPLIEQCPVNLECKVAHILLLGSHALVIGSIEETHVSESCLTDGKPDIDKIKPFAYAVAPVHQYYGLGKILGKAFSLGEELKVGG